MTKSVEEKKGYLENLFSDEATGILKKDFNKGLCYAASLGDTASVQRLFTQFPDHTLDNNFRDEDDRSAIEYAAKHLNFNMIAELSKNGAKITPAVVGQVFLSLSISMAKVLAVSILAIIPALVIGMIFVFGSPLAGGLTLAAYMVMGTVIDGLKNHHQLSKNFVDMGAEEPELNPNEDEGATSDSPLLTTTLSGPGAGP